MTERKPEEWYIARVRPDGPFDALEISRRLRKGEIGDDDWLWAPGPRVWIRVGDASGKKAPGRKKANARRTPTKATARPRQIMVFRAWRLALLAAIATISMAVIAIVDLPAPPGILACGVFCVCLSWFISECQGIRVSAGAIVAPRRLALLPALYRRTTAMGSIGDMWLLKSMFGLPRLIVDAHHRAELLIFDSPSQRRQFVSALRTFGLDPQIHRLA